MHALIYAGMLGVAAVPHGGVARMATAGCLTSPSSRMHIVRVLDLNGSMASLLPGQGEALLL